jgi:hypothetical protein
MTTGYWASFGHCGLFVEGSKVGRREKGNEGEGGLGKEEAGPRVVKKIKKKQKGAWASWRLLAQISLGNKILYQFQNIFPNCKLI